MVETLQSVSAPTDLCKALVEETYLVKLRVRVISLTLNPSTHADVFPGT
jgi:hypothetical protein